MRYAILLGAIAGLGLACTASEPKQITAPDRPLLAHVPDLDGTPDIIVDQKELANSWVIYNETFAPTACDIIEGDVTAGEHKTLRISVSTPNVGTADLVVGDPNIHIDPNGDGNYSDSDGLFEFATCHHHFHFRHYATYELLPVLANGSLGTPIIAAKRGFCMIDVIPANEGTPTKSWVYRSCGHPGDPGNQGISTGWADQYYKWLQGQFFVIDGLPAGRYVIRIHVNPPFAAQRREPCPAKDPLGYCHQFAESNYSNNIGQIAITIPEGRTGKTGYGAGGGKEIPSNANAIDDENRPTK
jgi:lysyl oxidase